MGIISGVVDSIDGILDWIGTLGKAGIADYVDMETANDTHTLVSKDGSLVSILRIDGTTRLFDPRSYLDETVEPLMIKTQSLFKNKGYKMQFYFCSDPDNTASEIKKVLSPARETSERLKLDMLDLLEEREKELQKYIFSEVCYLVLWTTPSILTKNELKNDREAKKKYNKDHISPILKNSQDPLRGLETLENKHSAFVNSMQTALREFYISTQKIKVHDAIREMRKTVDLGFTDANWRPSLPGDTIYPTIRKNAPAMDSFDIMWPKLGWQICPRDATIIENNVVEIGDRIYAPLYLDNFPQDIMSFETLFMEMRKYGLPWRISFLIEGGGLSSYAFKGAIAKLTGFAGGNNKMISRHISDLQELQKNSETIVNIRAVLATWANKGDITTLRNRFETLNVATTAWGSPQTSQVTGDPIAGVMSSALAVTQGSIGTKAAAPLYDVYNMMPLSRPGSPWTEGAVTWRSPDGKLMPYQPYSDKQTTWINLIFAKPGSGKSVLMNVCNLALCLSPKLAKLPRIAIIDIGPSSSGLISLIKEGLPEDQKHLAVYKMLRNSQEDCINVFDTRLGCRYPTALEKSFLDNFITLLAMDPAKEIPYDGMLGLVSLVIQTMYMKYAYDDAKTFSTGTVPSVDYAIRELKRQGQEIEIDRKTTWWEIVDFLFDNNKIYEAELAQRYAMPTLKDVTAILKDEKIRQEFDTKKIDNSTESIIDAMSHSIQSALRFYPVLSDVTRFDVSSARIVSLNLEQVAKTGGALADRTTAIMYMLARHVLTKDFYIDHEISKEVPGLPSMMFDETVPVKKYKAYHEKIGTDTLGDFKRICMDEFHKAAKAKAVIDQVIIDMREGRKYRVDVMLASQSLEDFDDRMKEFATGIFVMAGGNRQAIETIATKFGLNSQAELTALERSIHGPRPGGGTFLAKFDTVEGWYTLLLSSPLGPIELWAFSTHADDAFIRNNLYKRMRPKNARRALATLFPSGSAKNAVKERMTEDALGSQEEQESILAELAEEIYQKAVSMGLA